MLYSFNIQCDNLWDCFPKLPIQEVYLEWKNGINQQVTMETVTDLILGGSKITAYGDCSNLQSTNSPAKNNFQLCSKGEISSDE